MGIRMGLFGFGKTGKVVANEIIQDQDCELRWVMRRSQANEGEFASHLLGHKQDEGRIVCYRDVDLDRFHEENPVDVIVDFSASCAVDEYAPAARRGARVISAISRYEPEDLAKLEALGAHTAVLYAPNITLGINFLIVAAKVLQQIVPHADIEVVEEHFRAKPETSGTALRIAADLGLDTQRQVNSIRVGGIIGKHEVIFGLPNQTIRLVHESISRAAFGQGAIFGAKWLLGRDRGLFSMEQVVRERFAANIHA
ncbi:MAG: dihydrodipicolinate reductase C-terminal domain-containing protein [Lentisphaeria bacterium]|jgi:4-hydroxy-tetrahydrodipicolinate reductase